MLKRIVAAVALMALPLLASADDFVAGKDYKVLANPGGVVIQPGHIEVREFFWYGCPHCFKLDPFIEAWLSSKPANVDFVRTPAALNSTWEVNARGFYVAQSQGLEAKTHVALFNTIHKNHQQLFDQQSLAQFYAGYGLPVATFNGLYNSFMVSGKISESQRLASQYQLDGVPAVVVDGKYVIQGESDKVIKVLDYLIAKEEALLPKPATSEKHSKHKAA